MELLSKEVLPFVANFLLLVALALGLDLVLHLSGQAWIGRQLGPVGTVMILVSLAYSARKRKKVTWGKPKAFLRFHEWLSWLGSLAILVHAGIHINALIPWLATLAMLISCASGLVGKYLLQSSSDRLKAKQDRLKQEGMPLDQIQEQILWEAALVKSMKDWRKLHFPLTFTFAILTLLHLAGVFLLG